MTPPDLAERIVEAIRPIVRLHGVEASNVDGDILTNAVRALLPQAGELGDVATELELLAENVVVMLPAVRENLLRQATRLRARPAPAADMDHAMALLRRVAAWKGPDTHGRLMADVDAFLAAHPPAPEPAP